MARIARRRFRPRLGASVAAFVGLAVLVGLGTWQIQRLHWKEALIADMAARIAAAPVALPANLVDAAALAYVPVRLEGRFLHDKEMYLGARTYRGTVGFHVVTPLILDDGRAVLVDRGWVPPARKAPDTRPESQPPGPVVVDGLIRLGGWRGAAMFRPANEPARNLWLWPDLPAMAAWAGLERPVTQVYVAAGPAPNPGGPPIGGQTRIELRNDHLLYAVTWYALAVALLVIYVLHQSRPMAAEEGP